MHEGGKGSGLVVKQLFGEAAEAGHCGQAAARQRIVQPTNVPRRPDLGAVANTQILLLLCL